MSTLNFKWITRRSSNYVSGLSKCAAVFLTFRCFNAFSHIKSMNQINARVTNECVRSHKMTRTKTRKWIRYQCQGHERKKHSHVSVFHAVLNAHMCFICCIFYFISPNGHFDDDIEFLKSGYRTRFYAQSIETQVQSKHFVTIEMSTIMIASISLLWFGCDEHFCLFSLEIIGLYRFSIQIQI